jgi:integrase
MSSKKTPTQKVTESKPTLFIDYKPARYHTGKTGKDCYISYYALEPCSQKLKIKKIRLNNIRSKAERKKMAIRVIQRVNNRLEKGWNPFIESNNSPEYKLFTEACESYLKSLSHSLKNDLVRKATYDSYTSYMHVIREYNDERIEPIKYIYQFNKEFVRDVLDYVYEDKQNSTRTRDMYLAFLRVISGFFMERGFITHKPTETFHSIAKKSSTRKNRTIISDETLIKIWKWLGENNPNYLLGCYFCYYCFIRPHEISQIKIQDVNMQNSTIMLFAEQTKNKKDAVVTIPETMLNLLKTLKIDTYPKDWYIFSDNFMPGSKYKSGKNFRDYWHSILKKHLKLPDEYKFYSLKDTGITKLLHYVPVIMVRDQARHHSLSMTDKYTPLEIIEANEKIKGIEF